MERGLKEFKGSDKLFSQAVVPTVISSVLLTSAWYILVQKARLTNCKLILKSSLPVVLLASYYFSNGFAMNYVGAKETFRVDRENRIRELEHYKREYRSNTRGH